MALIGEPNDDNPRIHIPLGRRHSAVLIHRYEALSILNDIFIGIFFTVGSVFFFFPQLETLALTLFLLGSIDFLLRPVIRLAHRMNVVHSGDESADGDSYEY